jgi:predicted nuclease with TOPRIM domain
VELLSLVWHVLQGVVIVTAAGFGLYWLNRQAYVKTLERAVEGWRALAEMRSQEIAELRQRVAALEADLRRLVAENEQLRQLNLSYQAQLAEMQLRLRQLEECR